MSEANVFTQLGSILGAITVTSAAPNIGRNTIKRVFTSAPTVPPVPADFPCWLLMKDPNAENRIDADSVGGARHIYTILGYLLIAFQNTPFLEQQAMVQPWAEKIVTALSANRNLNNACIAAFDINNDTLATYTQAQISFGEGADYYGLRLQMTITESL